MAITYTLFDGWAATLDYDALIASLPPTNCTLHDLGPSSSVQRDALSFNGTTSSIKIPDGVATSLNGNSVATIEMELTFKKEDISTARKDLFSLTGGGTSLAKILVFMEDKKIGVYARAVSTDGAQLGQSTLTYITSMRMKLVVEVDVSAGTIKIWNNEYQVVDQSGLTFGQTTFDAGVGTAGNTIGSNSAQTSNFFNGTIRAVKISGDVSGTIGDWALEAIYDDAGTLKTADASANNYHGLTSNVTEVTLPGYNVYGVSYGNLDGNKPIIMLQGGIHGGHEWTSAHWPVELVKYIADPTGRTNEAQLERLRDKFDWYCIVCLNPWGYAIEDDSVEGDEDPDTGWPAGRGTEDAVDLNRVFDYSYGTVAWESDTYSSHHGTNMGAYAWQSAESIISRDKVLELQPIIVVDCHNYSSVSPGIGGGHSWGIPFYNYDLDEIRDIVETNMSITTTQYAWTSGRQFKSWATLQFSNIAQYTQAFLMETGGYGYDLYGAHIVNETHDGINMLMGLVLHYESLYDYPIEFDNYWITKEGGDLKYCSVLTKDGSVLKGSYTLGR